ncbi:ABC transporter ATP-binding protein [Desulfothermus okinawensis JCM 13304]
MNKKLPFVSLVNITKKFGDIIANNDISLDVYKGEILAILGENGAGKSTLMKILSGNLSPDSGKILIEGREKKIKSPKHSTELGIGMVHQHFKLIPAFTVMENIVLGDRSYKIFKEQKFISKIKKLSDLYGLKIDPRKKIKDLSMGERQRVEILKLLYKDVKLLILDEPTTVLTPVEITGLFNSLKNMKKEGKAIIFISHKLEEVMEISDEIAILRKGEIIDRIKTDNVSSPDELAKKMVGKQVILEIEKKESSYKEETVLKLENIKGETIKDVSIEVKKGEIHGIVGVAGNGQRELIDIVYGFKRPLSGEINILGLRWEDFYEKGQMLESISYIPEDRTNMGCCMELSIWENFLLTTRNIFSKGVFVKNKLAKDHALKWMKKYKVHPLDINLKARQLSGGNLQKVVVARELFKRPKLVIAEQPSQGLDIAATREVWKYLVDARQDAGVLLLTGDLKEALTLADTISVIFKGEIIITFNARDKEKVENIGMYIAGIRESKKDIPLDQSAQS